jgi:hypothetical protein
MKKIFSIEVTEEDGMSSFLNHVQGVGLSLIISDLQEWLRSKSKYEDQEMISIEEVREKIVELKNEYQIIGDL